MVLSGATTPAAMHAALRAHGCLSLFGRVVPGRVVACLATALADQARVSRAPGWAGPTPEDAAAAALARSRYLSARGRRMHAAAP